MALRQIILDTETTGLDPVQGHRIVEIGCIEIVDRRFSGRNFHRYLNPERDSDEAALEVHGLTREFLSDKPRFGDIAGELQEFVADAEIIIHNAPFDLAFLDAELARAKKPAFRQHVALVTDSLAMAKEAHPGKRNNLDALCDRYGISNAHRTLHGALLDSQLLAEVYLAMTRGQDGLMIDEEEAGHTEASPDVILERLETFVVSASKDEEGAHVSTLASIAKQTKKSSVWELT